MRMIGWVASGFLLLSTSAYALDYQWDDVTFTLNSRVSAGATMRMQRPDYDLFGKLNVPGQQNLCTSDNCISFTPISLLNPSTNAQPNDRLVAAQGAFSGTNGDNGDINYAYHDIVAATDMIDSDLKIAYNDFLFRVRGIGYLDPANFRREDRHNNTLYQPAFTPRESSTTSVYAKNVRLMEAYGQYTFSLAGHNGTVSVGQQTVRWGESTLIAINSLNEINPPNSEFLHIPGAQINQIFQPVPLGLLSFDVVEGVSMDLLYQFGWKPVQPDAAGSYFSSSDIAGGGRYAMIGLGQFPEDPYQEQKPASGSALSLLSSTAFSTRVLPASYGAPKSTGQYGAKIGYNADWLNGGTELGFYFLNYHSRFPYASVISTNNSCARNAITAVDALVDCNAFNGSLSLNTANSILSGLGAPSLPTGLQGKEPAPIDTLKVFLDYPENIHMFGLSFNTNVGPWSIAGEYSYRPDMPLQVQLTDVVFAGLQPALPVNSGLGVPGVLILPSAQQAFPDYLMTRYRKQAVAANQYIPGYQRFKVGQFDLTGIKAFSSNPFGADQIIWIIEAGFTQIYDLPGMNQLQIEGGDLNDTHHSPGADGTGNGGVKDNTHFNPTQQNSGFATKFAWGMRSIIQMEYNDVIFGWAFKPQIILLHDMTGTAPSPNQNFIAGRSQAQVGSDINFSQSLTGHAHYEWYWGGDRYSNPLRDRDNLSVSLSYSF